MRASLARYEAEEDDFLGHIMVSDDSWVHHFQLETK
jgi:hypothetical protein